MRRISLGLVAALAASLPRLADAGLSFGGVASTDGCYTALQNAKRPDGSNVVDREGYAAFINELSGEAFSSFQYDEASDQWGMFPVKDFNDLPTAVRNEFYKHACGGAFVICDNAYLYVDGTEEGASAPSPQQEVYLFQLCKGVDDAIDEAKKILGLVPVPQKTPPPTPPRPTAKPTFPPLPTYEPTAAQRPTERPVETFTGDAPLQLTYRALVSSSISAEELQESDSVIREQLLAAMTVWSMETAKDIEQQKQQSKQQMEEQSSSSTTRKKKRIRNGNGRRRLARGGGGGGEREDWSRELFVAPAPTFENDGVRKMDVIDVGEFCTNSSI